MHEVISIKQFILENETFQNLLIDQTIQFLQSPHAHIFSEENDISIKHTLMLDSPYNYIFIDKKNDFFLIAKIRENTVKGLFDVCCDIKKILSVDSPLKLYTSQLAIFCSDFVFLKPYYGKEDHKLHDIITEMESCKTSGDSFLDKINNENLDYTIKHLKEKTGKQPKSTHDIFTLYHYMEFIYKFTGNIACKKPIKFYKDIISFQADKINSSKKAIHLVSEVFETKQALTDRQFNQKSPFTSKNSKFKAWMDGDDLIIKNSISTYCVKNIDSSNIAVFFSHYFDIPDHETLSHLNHIKSLDDETSKFLNIALSASGHKVTYFNEYYNEKIIPMLHELFCEIVLDI